MSLLCAIGLAVTACSAPTPTVAVTPLPTAVPPSTSPATWAIGFQHEFPPDFWNEGRHRYALYIKCPGPDGANISTDWIYFQVSEDAQLQPSPVYLRLQGLSTEAFIPAYSSRLVIHPAQSTSAVAYLIGMPRDAVDAAMTECERYLFWDEGGRAILDPLEPFQP
jgi:hypothetical protein